MTTYPPCRTLFVVTGEVIKSGAWVPVEQGGFSTLQGATEWIDAVSARADYRNLTVIVQVTIHVPVNEWLDAPDADLCYVSDDEPEPVVAPMLQEQLDNDTEFAHLLLRQHQELSALTARHSQEFLQRVLVYRREQKEAS